MEVKKLKLAMCIITLVVCIATADCLAAETNAAQPELRYGPIRGESLMTFGGDFTHSELSNGFESKTDSLTAQIGIGYFTHNNHEVGFQGIINHSRSKYENSTRTSSQIGCYPYYNYNFRVNPRSWLYAGPHAGIVYSDYIDDNDITWSFGLHAGLRFWLTSATSFFIEQRFTHTEFDFGGGKTESDVFKILLGLNLRF
jgi:hypothetical protein